MRLVSLRIYKKINNETIRLVQFNEHGLSLICDEEGNEHHYSGSSIGKTAFAKCIDICLGSSTTKQIYTSSGMGINEELKDYIITNQISLQLTVKNNKKEYLLERHLFDNKEFIDNRLYTNYKNYNKDLLNIFFPECPSNLSFREIMPKFVRLESDDAFKYIFRYGKNETYYYAYNYLLNLYVDNDESSLILEKEELNKENVKIMNKYKFESLEDFNNKIELTQKELNLKRDNIIKNDYVGQYSSQDNINSDLIYEMDDLTEQLYSKKFRLKIIEENIKKEDNKLFEIDSEALKLLYDDAKDIFGTSLKNYDEFVDFHNKMCSLRKNSYINEKNILIEEIKELEKEVCIIRNNFNEKFVDYKVKVNDTSNSLYDQYYGYKLELNSMINSRDKYKSNLERVSEINKKLSNIEQKKTSNEDNKNRFATIFKGKCEKILNEKVEISFNSSPKDMPIYAKGLGGKFGTGDTKSFICAFDFSLYDFFVEKSLQRPEFIVHDKMENVSLDNLKIIFNDVRNSGIQYILPILHDRIDSLNITKSEIVLSLSKEEKLFKI